MADALADLAKGPLLEEARVQCAVVHPRVVAIVAQLPVVAEKQSRIDRRSRDVLEAYVNGRWFERREADAHTAEVELVTLGSRVKALLADIAGLSVETRKLLDRDLAIAARRLSYLWDEENRELEDGSNRLGLGRSCLEFELLMEVANSWAVPQEGEGRRGRLEDHAADNVASAALEAYEDLTQRRVNRSFQENRDCGEFLDFLKQVYSLFDIDQGIEYRVRKALDARKIS